MGCCKVEYISFSENIPFDTIADYLSPLVYLVSFYATIVTFITTYLSTSPVNRSHVIEPLYINYTVYDNIEQLESLGLTRNRQWIDHLQDTMIGGDFNKSLNNSLLWLGLMPAAW